MTQRKPLPLYREFSVALYGHSATV